MTLPKNAKVLYAMAGGAVVLTAGLLYVQNNSLGDVRTKVAALRTEADQEKDANAKLMQAERDLTALKAQLAHLEQGIPDPAYVPTMLKELEAMGKTQAVEVTGLRPVPPKAAAFGDKKALEAKPYEPLDLELKGKAQYRDLLKFVTALNNFPKILEVRTLTITPDPMPVAGSDGRLQITMGIRAFLFKQPDPNKKDGLSA